MLAPFKVKESSKPSDETTETTRPRARSLLQRPGVLCAELGPLKQGSAYLLICISEEGRHVAPFGDLLEKHHRLIALAPVQDPAYPVIELQFSIVSAQDPPLPIIELQLSTISAQDPPFKSVRCNFQPHPHKIPPLKSVRCNSQPCPHESAEEGSQACRPSQDQTPFAGRKLLCLPKRLVPTGSAGDRLATDCTAY